MMEKCKNIHVKIENSQNLNLSKIRVGGPEMTTPWFLRGLYQITKFDHEGRRGQNFQKYDHVCSI